MSWGNNSKTSQPRGALTESLGKFPVQCRQRRRSRTTRAGRKPEGHAPALEIRKPIMASSLSPRGDRLLSIATLLATAAAFAIVAVDLSDGPDLPEIPPDHRPRVINGWESLFRSTDGSHTVRVAVFSDYLCPYSADVAQTMLALDREYADVLVEYRGLPQRGELSDVAAAIAECSRASGRFEEMHHALFSFVDSLGVAPWEQLAAHAGVVDTVAFRNCAFGSQVPAGVERDIALAEMLGVTATPSILVDSLLFQGSPGPAYLEAYVRHARWRNRAASSRRTSR